MYSRGLVVRVALGAAAALGLGVVATSGLGSRAATPASGPASASPAAASHTVAAPGRRPDVVVVGESLVHQVSPIEGRLLRRDGFVADIESRDSEDLGSPFVQHRIDDAVAAGTPIVVIETASNDAYQGAGTAPPADWAPALRRYRATLAATLAKLSHQCTVLVDTRVSHTSKWYELGRIGPGIDRAIDASALRHRDSVEAVRWSSMSAAHGSDWFWTDGLHFGDPSHLGAGWHQAGANAFADAIAAGVERCSADLRSG